MLTPTRDPALDDEAAAAGADADADALPDWATADPGDDPMQPVAWGALAFRAGLAGVVVVMLHLLGHRWPAVIVATVVTISSALAVAVPAFGRAIERLMAAIQSLAGRVLSALLLGLFHLVVFVPVSLLLRLVRHDPLALGASRDDDSFWREAARRRGKPLHRRPFAYERHPRSRTTRRRPLRSGLALLVVIVLLDLGVGTLVTGEDAPAISDDEPVYIPVPEMAATNEPWEQELFVEISETLLGIRYHPYRGFTLPSAEGAYVNVTDGVRHSYQAQLDRGGEPIEIWFFGGSAMFGWYQRDEHTIASEVVRLAEADGIEMVAVNHGQAAYTIWQELQLIEEALSQGDRPDVAVFYDGANEIGAQFRMEDPSYEPTHMQDRATDAIIEASKRTDEPDPPGLLDTYSSHSALAELWRRTVGEDGPDQPSLTPTVNAPAPDQRDRPGERGTAAAEVHGRAVGLIEALSESYGFESAFFWQPGIYSKRLLPGEHSIRRTWGNDPVAWQAASDQARADLDPSVIDLSHALDDLDQPVMYDYVHTNELGARAVAHAIYEQLRPSLMWIQEVDRA